MNCAGEGNRKIVTIFVCFLGFFGVLCSSCSQSDFVFFLWLILAIKVFLFCRHSPCVASFVYECFFLRQLVLSILVPSLMSSILRKKKNRKKIEKFFGLRNVDLCESYANSIYPRQKISSFEIFCILECGQKKPCSNCFSIQGAQGAKIHLARLSTELSSMYCNS
jgi:hypothetical protein